MQKVLILTAGFGEGHNAAARNLREALELASDDVQVEVLDLLESAYCRLNTLVKNTYLKGCDQKWRSLQPAQTRTCSAEKTDRRENLENRKAGETGLCRLRSCFRAFQIDLFPAPPIRTATSERTQSQGLKVAESIKECIRENRHVAITLYRDDGTACAAVDTLRQPMPAFAEPDAKL